MQIEDSFVADEKRPLIPEGEYTVQCFKIEKGYSHYKSLKMFLTFRVIDGPHMEIELFMAMNLTDSHTGKPFKKVPKGSKYYNNWVIANNNCFPSRKDRMSFEIFKSGIFKAVVRTVKPKFSDGTEKPECFHYSIIDYLKRRLP